MRRYAVTFLDETNCPGVREIWEECDAEAGETSRLIAAASKWRWHAVTEMPA